MMSDYDDHNSYSEDDITDVGTNNDNGNGVLCAFCDDGGYLTSCIGRCKRSFHPRMEDGIESACRTLGYTSAELEEMGDYLCENCKHNQHQCFKCGELEPSAEPNAKANIGLPRRLAGPGAVQANMGVRRLAAGPAAGVWANIGLRRFAGPAAARAAVGVRSNNNQVVIDDEGPETDLDMDED